MALLEGRNRTAYGGSHRRFPFSVGYAARRRYRHKQG
nr:MAG TPA: hypothetical protein [Caudoviricetes sp.]